LEKAVEGLVEISNLLLSGASKQALVEKCKPLAENFAHLFPKFSCISYKYVEQLITLYKKRTD
jgi:hypothetical protein